MERLRPRRYARVKILSEFATTDAVPRVIICMGETCKLLFAPQVKKLSQLNVSALIPAVHVSIKPWFIFITR